MVRAPNILSTTTVLILSLFPRSDGAITGLSLAMSTPNRIQSLFAFASSYHPLNQNQTANDSPVVQEFDRRSFGEYHRLAPADKPHNYIGLAFRVATTWATSPMWDEATFRKIPEELGVWIVDGEKEEVVEPEVPKTIHSWVSVLMLFRRMSLVLKG